MCMLLLKGIISDEEIEAYKPKRRYPWDRMEPMTGLLDEDDPYPLDKQLLIKLQSEYKVSLQELNQ